ncbi:hypothetical protein HanRHA438_Chr05g0227911 [Helianthus annuus]|nr:hypothetical protein HanRHA438_Chr05g0227911 [Helianthus annuus]
MELKVRRCIARMASVLFATSNLLCSHDNLNTYSESSVTSH